VFGKGLIFRQAEKVVLNKVMKIDYSAQKMIGLNGKESFKYQIMEA
jgi:hypothetical protein